MTVQEWLSDLKYDPEGQIICKNDDGFNKILDIRGWATLQKVFPSIEEAGKFQDSVGQFVLEAINEKLENDRDKEETWKNIAAGLNISIEEAKKVKIEGKYDKLL